LGGGAVDVVVDLYQKLLKELVPTSVLDLVIKLLAAVMVAGLAYVAPRVWRSVWAWIRNAVLPLWESRRKICQLRKAVDEKGPGLWLSVKPQPEPANIAGTLQKLNKLILTVANLKGGVGKTTLTTNLAAYFANPLNAADRIARNVLVVDLDYQGSCSSVLFGEDPWRPDENKLSAASQIISRELPIGGQIGQHARGVERVRGISAFYDLASTENRLMIKWLLGDEKHDIRFNLASTLLSDAVLNSFDVILIDAPPRLTTASVQALCASTHVLIPTVLDPLSADDPVGYFGLQLKAHVELWPQLVVMGVVGSMTEVRQRSDEELRLKIAGDRLGTALNGATGRLRYMETRKTRFEFPYECSIRSSTPLARAAVQGIPYAAIGDNSEGRGVRAMVDSFGKEVVRRWHL
jgi:cellulose biosynthesis protein BcsQ